MTSIVRKSKMEEDN